MFQVRTAGTAGFTNSKILLASLAAVGLVGCEMPPEEEVGAFSNELMSIVRNTAVADRVTGTVDMVFTLSRLDPPGQATTAFFSTLVAGGNGFTPASAGASCGAGVDYIAVTNRPIPFAAGVTTTSTTVTVCGDNLTEGTEHLFAKLVDANNQCEGELCLGIGRITDNPSLSIADITVREPLTGEKHATVTISMSQQVPRDVSFTVKAVNDSATDTFGNGQYLVNCASRLIDYMAPDRNVIIPQGELTATYDVTICGDRVEEPTQRFFVDVSSASNATIADSRAIVTITDMTLQLPQLP